MGRLEETLEHAVILLGGDLAHGSFSALKTGNRPVLESLRRRWARAKRARGDEPAALERQIKHHFSRQARTLHFEREPREGGAVHSARRCGGS